MSEVVYYSGRPGGISMYSDGFVSAAYGSSFNLPVSDSHGGWIISAADLLRFAVAVDGDPVTPEFLSPIFTDAGVDTVITLCAEENCPLWLGRAHRVHWALPDPAAATGTEDEVLDSFRRVRDEICRRLEELFTG